MSRWTTVFFALFLCLFIFCSATFAGTLTKPDMSGEKGAVVNIPIDVANTIPDPMTTVALPTCLSCGDVNKDGVLDISDVILALRCALGLPIDPYQCMPCGDINDDGKVDISDVILTLRMALGLDPLKPCQFPKLANQLQGYVIESAVLEEASYWDLLVVDSEVIVGQPQYFGPSGILRKTNPSLVSLAYFSTADIIPGNTAPVNGGFIQGLKDAWYMKDIYGQRVKLFEILPGFWTEMLNQTTGVNIFLPSYLQDKVISTGLTDGIFYDWSTDSISWLNHRAPNPNGPLDINNDGKPDSDEELDMLWISGFSEMLQNSRNIFSAGTLILGNKGWVGGNSYDHLLNGMMTERFLEGEQYGFDWDSVMRSYYLNCRDTEPPRLSFIMANRDNPKEFKFMRYALASTLMFDGYFSFTNVSGPYYSTWWFDEYSVNLETGRAEKSLQYKGYLGQPLGDAFNSLNPLEKLKDVLLSGGIAKVKVWRRDFTNGMVLVNPSSVPVNVNLNRTFKKIKGDIDPEFNNGDVLNSILLEAYSGVILLRSN